MTSTETTPEPFDVLLSPRVVLVAPRGGANVGSVCRAMKNMGADALFIVDGCYDRKQARLMAVHGGDVFEARREVASIRDAIEGCGVVVGTTARSGAYRRRSRDVRELARELVGSGRAAAGAIAGRPLALLFGREDRGLSNQDIAVCHHLVCIPTSPAYTSLNLAQAAMITLYEIYRARLEAAAAAAEHDQSQPMPADARDFDDAMVALERALLAIGFLSSENPQHIMVTIRAMLGRALPDERELRIVRGIARQLEWFGAGGSEVARDKRERGEKLK